MKKILFISFFTVIYCSNIFSQKSDDSHDHNHVGLHHWEILSKDPDRIILTFNGDPSSKRAVTWRTDSSVKKSVAQIALAGVNFYLI